MALRDSYLDGRGDDSGSDDSIPAKARDAHRQLVDWTGIGGRLELDTAESVLANHYETASGEPGVWAECPSCGEIVDPINAQ